MSVLSMSDIDVIIVGGSSFVGRNIFALAEDLREISGKDADVFELREATENTPFYDSVIRGIYSDYPSFFA